jgi:hypothetical protein
MWTYATLQVHASVDGSKWELVASSAKRFKCSCLQFAQLLRGGPEELPLAARCSVYLLY